MSTEIRVPITVSGWIVLRDLSIARVEIDRQSWEYGPLPYVSAYGDQTDVIVFHESGADPRTDRIEADVNITDPIHKLIDAHDPPAHRWMAGTAVLDEPDGCVPKGDGTLGPSEGVSRRVKDHLNDLRDGYPNEFDEFMAERFPGSSW